MQSLISLLAFLAAVWSSDADPSMLRKREFRATWVATAYNIDWPSTKGLSTSAQQAEFLHMVDQQQALGMNAIVVQIRAAGDAFYPSELAPWSEFLTGEQGKAPDPYYDPLAFMIEACHERNIEFHAWFNPFRGISHVRFSSVADQNLLLQHPEWTFQYGETRFLDPGIPEVRDHLVSIVCEVLRKYDIDGIHFDDYFYPYRKNGQPLPDDMTFSRYAEGFTEKKAWRRYNIDRFIERVADSITVLRPEVKFGVSPVGIWRNKDQDPLGSNSAVDQTAYDVLHADVRKWLQLGWIDYVAPQLYWSTQHPRANYAELLPWWAQNSFGRHLYVGQALFKIKQVQSRHWDNPTQLPEQLALNLRYPEVQGSIFYSANTFRDRPNQVAQMLSSSRYRYPALVPPMPWKDSIPPLAPEDLLIMGHRGGALLSWRPSEVARDGQEATYYVVYRFPRGVPMNQGSPEHIVATRRDTSYVDLNTEPGEAYTYLVTACDRLHNESRTCAAANWYAQRPIPMEHVRQE